MITSEFLALVPATPIDGIAAMQERRLRQFIARTRGAVSYYGNQFEPLTGAGSSFFERWREMPILQKETVREEMDRLTVVFPPANAGRVFFNNTSGGTGEPMKVLTSQRTRLGNKAMNARALRLWNTDGGKTLVVTKMARQREEQSGASDIDWHPDGRGGAFHIVNATELRDQYVEIAELRPNYLKSWPPVLEGLAQYVSDNQLKLNLELILSGGMVLADHVRQTCLDAFGCRIADLFGTVEAGLIAFECPDCGEYHMCFENNFTEIIKDNGEPAEPGETGRIITTNFRNDVMPLVRYDSGDYAQRGFGIGSCGRQPYTLRRILGRAKNLFLRRDGSKFWPHLPHDLIEEAGVRRYRVVQTDRLNIEFHCLPVRNRLIVEQPLIADLKRNLGDEFDIVIKQSHDEKDFFNPKRLIYESLAV